MEIGECPICFDPLDNTKDIAVLECKHRYHLSCLKDWYNKENVNYKCPMCFVPRNIESIIEKKNKVYL